MEGQPDTRPHLCWEAVMGSRRGGVSWGAEDLAEVRGPGQSPLHPP